MVCPPILEIRQPRKDNKKLTAPPPPLFSPTKSLQYELKSYRTPKNLHERKGKMNVSDDIKK